jgi:1,2-phenylacetyl-CoA epoxidase catalytic subunit
VISLARGYILFSRYMVPKLEEKILIMKKMHNEIGHFGEAKMFVEIKR